jgi:hypothetical protein
VNDLLADDYVAHDYWYVQVLHLLCVSREATPLTLYLHFFMFAVPLEEYGPWSEKGHGPEADFLAKIKAIDGVSQVETQTITNVEI